MLVLCLCFFNGKIFKDSMTAGAAVFGFVYHGLISGIKVMIYCAEMAL